MFAAPYHVLSTDGFKAHDENTQPRVSPHFRYPNEVGPGVYDIHSPNIPTHDHLVQLMTKAAERIPPERLWVNPDCWLKTRQWGE